MSRQICLALLLSLVDTVFIFCSYFTSVILSFVLFSRLIGMLVGQYISVVMAFTIAGAYFCFLVIQGKNSFFNGYSSFDSKRYFTYHQSLALTLAPPFIFWGKFFIYFENDFCFSFNHCAFAIFILFCCGYFPTPLTSEVGRRISAIDDYKR